MEFEKELSREEKAFNAYQRSINHANTLERSGFVATVLAAGAALESRFLEAEDTRAFIFFLVTLLAFTCYRIGSELNEDLDRIADYFNQTVWEAPRGSSQSSAVLRHGNPPPPFSLQNTTTYEYIPPKKQLYGNAVELRQHNDLPQMQPEHHTIFTSGVAHN